MVSHVYKAIDLNLFGLLNNDQFIKNYSFVQNHLAKLCIIVRNPNLGSCDWRESIAIILFVFHFTFRFTFRFTISIYPLYSQVQCDEERFCAAVWRTQEQSRRLELF